ncbi:MAG: hypothetical protein QXE01_11910 [Sulfolobales archaeon]
MAEQEQQEAEKEPKVIRKIYLVERVGKYNKKMIPLTLEDLREIVEQEDIKEAEKYLQMAENESKVSQKQEANSNAIWIALSIIGILFIIGLIIYWFMFKEPLPLNGETNG